MSEAEKLLNKLYSSLHYPDDHDVAVLLTFDELILLRNIVRDHKNKGWRK